MSSAIAAGRCDSQKCVSAVSRSSGGFKSCWNRNWTARSRASRRLPIPLPRWRRNGEMGKENFGASPGRAPLCRAPCSGRIYRFIRWLGLAVLACAPGRVVVFDCLEAGTIYRGGEFHGPGSGFAGFGLHLQQSIWRRSGSGCNAPLCDFCENLVSKSISSSRSKRKTRLDAKCVSELHSQQ